jgi:hypothetical protein
MICTWAAMDDKVTRWKREKESRHVVRVQRDLGLCSSMIATSYLTRQMPAHQELFPNIKVFIISRSLLAIVTNESHTTIKGPLISIARSTQDSAPAPEEERKS